MNDNYLKYGVIGLVIAALVWMFTKQKKAQDTGTSQAGILPDLPIPVKAGPAPDGSQNVPYSINSGEGLQRIKETAARIAKDPERGASILAQTTQSPYQGLAFAPDMRSWIAQLFGSAQSVPVFSSYTNSDYKGFLEALQEPDYMKLAGERGREGASAIVRPLMQYRDLFTFWGPVHENGLSLARENERFNVPGASSESRTQEMGNFVSDTQTMAKNLIAKQRQFDQALQKEAIEQLRRAGWKFVEIDGPNA